MIKTRNKQQVVAPKKATTMFKKQLTSFKISTFSRHPSHAILRRALPLLPFRAVVRLGSTTPSIRNIECNSIQGVKNSSSKLLMKQCFTRAGVRTAEWFTKTGSGLSFLNMMTDRPVSIDELPYPIISKSHYGSRGNGNVKHDDRRSLESFLRNHNTSQYIFEKFIPMTREYRLHVTKEGCFYTCRKLVRNDAPENTWQRHDDVCTWILETNPSFKKPNNWSAIVADCVTALEYLGLDIGAFDVMVQGSREGRERNNPEWIICESCSAPSFGEITAQKYIEEIPKVLRRKYESRRI